MQKTVSVGDLSFYLMGESLVPVDPGILHRFVFNFSRVSSLSFDDCQLSKLQVGDTIKFFFGARESLSALPIIQLTVQGLFYNQNTGKKIKKNLFVETCAVIGAFKPGKILSKLFSSFTKKSIGF